MADRVVGADEARVPPVRAAVPVGASARGGRSIEERVVELPGDPPHQDHVGSTGGETGRGGVCRGDLPAGHEADPDVPQVPAAAGQRELPERR